MWFVHYSQDQKWFDFVVQPFFMKYISISLIRLQSDSGITGKFYTHILHAHQESMFSSHFVVNEKKIDVIIQLIQLLVVAGFVLLHFPDFVSINRCSPTQCYSRAPLWRPSCAVWSSSLASLWEWIKKGWQVKNIFMKRHTCIFNTNRHINWKQITEGSIDHKVSLIKKFSSWYFHYFS